MPALQTLRRHLSDFLDLVLPPACPICGFEITQAPSPLLCPECLAGIHIISSPCCPRCCLPYDTEHGTDHLCETCLKGKTLFNWAKAAGIYKGTLRKAIHRFKYEGAVELDRPLGHLLRKALEESRQHFKPDLIIPVPLHNTRLKERTYNQALLLAKAIERSWRIPVAPRMLIRTHPSSPQQGLTAKARNSNLKGAFALQKKLDGEKILLIDDVMTTGATARECSRTLLAGGASEVAVGVLARAGRNYF